MQQERRGEVEGEEGKDSKNEREWSGCHERVRRRGGETGGRTAWELKQESGGEY